MRRSTRRAGHQPEPGRAARPADRAAWSRRRCARHRRGRGRRPPLAAGGFPAGVAGVVAVVDETSAGGRQRACRAPGTDVPTTLPGSRWGTVSGASYAAAHVSGLLALDDRRAGTGARTARLAAAEIVVAGRRADRRLRQPRPRRRSVRVRLRAVASRWSVEALTCALRAAGAGGSFGLARRACSQRSRRRAHRSAAAWRSTRTIAFAAFR